jgi:2-keto-4-pentenoate hydratase/2-oxohepta-3-ene-1,7-dioic acid hydratase in catechol pathway
MASTTGGAGTAGPLSESVDYEAELGVIIGRPAKDVAEADALSHVWGYTVVNDITARDIQFSEAQWSTERIIWPVDASCTTCPSTTAQMCRSCGSGISSAVTMNGPVGVKPSNDLQRDHCIAQLSHSATLLPGTLISTGSPGGAGYSRDPQIFLRDRSTVTVGIDGIGEVRPLTLATLLHRAAIARPNRHRADGPRGSGSAV